MKLSPKKVEQLSEQLVDELAEIDGILFQSNDSQLRLAIQEIITDELMVEDRLDTEVHQMLKAYKYEITQGRMKYDDLFKKTRQRLINERKIIL
jgi:hypothetical protein